jgi:hypothetical protein
VKQAFTRAKLKGLTDSGAFRYPRHFALLAWLAVLLAAGNRWLPVHGPVAWFGLYGALYSLALAVAVRRPQPLWRKGQFVLIGASLCVSNVIVGIDASRLPGVLVAAAGTSGILMVCAGLGAASYAILVCIIWRVTLTPLAIASITVLCSLATLGIAALHVVLRSSGLWVALAWWFAFSLGLWYHDGLRKPAPIGS